MHFYGPHLSSPVLAAASLFPLRPPVAYGANHYPPHDLLSCARNHVPHPGYLPQLLPGEVRRVSLFSYPDDKVLNLPTGRLGKLGRGVSGKRLQRLKAPKVLRPIRAQLEGCCCSLDFEDASEKSF